MIGFITKSEALELGMTHEGTICGVPCWLRDPHSNAPSIALKCLLLQPWVSLCDWAYDFYMRFENSDRMIEFPIRTMTEIASETSKPL